MAGYLSAHCGRGATQTLVDSTNRANEADQLAWESALRPKPCLLAIHSKLQEIVANKLILDWSPKQISEWLKQL